MNNGYEAYYKTFYDWLKLVRSGKTLQSFFDDNYIKTVAIYGMSELGKEIFYELKKLNIDILYAIDKNAEKIEFDEIEIFNPKENLMQVDAVIVTPLHFFAEIEEMLDKKSMKNIVSLEDVVRYCL